MSKSCPGSWSATSRWNFSIIFYFVFFVDILVDSYEFVTSRRDIFKIAVFIKTLFLGIPISNFVKINRRKLIKRPEMRMSLFLKILKTTLLVFTHSIEISQKKITPSLINIFTRQISHIKKASTLGNFIKL